MCIAQDGEDIILAYIQEGIRDGVRPLFTLVANNPGLLLMTFLKCINWSGTMAIPTTVLELGILWFKMGFFCFFCNYLNCFVLVHCREPCCDNTRQ